MTPKPKATKEGARHMTEDVRRATLEAIRRSGTVVAEARQEQQKIHRTLERSRRVDRERERRNLLNWFRAR
jgi:hypothetical protein